MSKLQDVFYYSKKTKLRDYGPFKCTVIGPLHAEFLGDGAWNVGSWGVKIADLNGSKAGMIRFMKRMNELGWPSDQPLDPVKNKDLVTIYRQVWSEMIRPVTFKGLHLGGYRVV